MGRISAPFGVKGWIKLKPFTASRCSLLDYPEWWVGGADGWQAFSVSGGHEQGAALVVKLRGCDGREAAAQLRGRQVAVARDALPRTGANEFYWVDLIGLRVESTGRYDFGVVAGVLETGANDVLVVVKDTVERLIPFIAEVIRKVDVEAGVITVNWGADY